MCTEDCHWCWSIQNGCTSKVAPVEWVGPASDTLAAAATDRRVRYFYCLVHDYWHKVESD